MANWVWNLQREKLVVYDEKLDKALDFDRDGISFYVGDKSFTVDPSIVASAYMEKPGFLFKKGVIALFGDDDEVIPCEGINLGVAVRVYKKYKNDFYLMYSVLKDNGIEVTVG